MVGGFIAPHGVFTSKLAQTWNGKIRKHIQNEFGDEQIANINRYKPWTSDGGTVSHTEFDFTHSKNNGKIAQNDCGDRREREKINDTIRSIQLRIVQMYAEKIREIGGHIVIFDDPQARDFGGNLATYLTITGKGIVVLYNTLMNRFGDSAPELFLMIAQRPNMEVDENRTTRETRVITLIARAYPGEITRDHYVQTIRNMAYGIAGSLLDKPEFTQLFTDEAHLKIEENGQDPKIIPCDFLCNTYYRGYNNEKWNGRDEYRAVYMDSALSIIVPVSTVDRMEESELTEMVERRSYLHTFLRLGRLGYPETQTAKFFEILNGLDVEEQRGFVNGFAEYYYIPMRNCSATGEIRTYIETMESLLASMKDVDGTERIANEGTRALLRANAQLYLMSLYIHLGWAEKVLTHTEAFKEMLREVPNGREKTNLMARYLNWQIVFYTDSFDYNRAEDTFGALSVYWDHVLEGRAWLLQDENNIFGTADVSMGEAQEQEYGEEIGSYLQVLTHRMRISSPEDRKKYYNEANELYGKYLAQFKSAFQYSRCYQNMCDLEAEMGQFDRAFLYLYNAVAVEDGGTSVNGIELTPENCLYY